jgi:hypothetical protein
MLTRAEAVSVIMEQLESCAQTTPRLHRMKGMQHHYGYQELRELLDLLYGPPITEGEKLEKWTS